MPNVRRTISLPAALADRLDREAKRRGISFSAVVAERVSRGMQPLPYAGLVEDDDGLSLRVEDVLGRLAR